MANTDVRRVMIDTGASCDIMYTSLFKTLQLTEKNLSPYVGNELFGFNGSSTQPWGYVELLVTFGEKQATKTIKIPFLVIVCPSLYNCIIGRTRLAKLGAACSTAHLKLKYHAKDGIITSLNGDIEAARRCFLQANTSQNSISQFSKPADDKGKADASTLDANLVELDPRFTKEDLKEQKREEKDPINAKLLRPIPDGEFELVPFGNDPSKNFKISKDLPELVKAQLVACLMENTDLFAWRAPDMPGINPSVAYHQLTVDPDVNVVAQRRRKQSPEKSEAAEKAAKDLLEANFISEAKYTTWLSNVVLVKKSNGKWRMCVDYTDLNRACPKDAYALPNIDKLVDNSSCYKLLSFMDAYSSYNQITMAEEDKKKTAFMTESGNYYYNVMSFGLRNVGATYQRKMNKVYDKALLGDILEVYMGDMIVKSQQEVDHAAHLKRVFEQTRKYNMWLNPKKCTLGVQAGKFLSFYLTESGIEANPDKCQAFTKLPTPHSKKCIQTLNGMLTALSRFVAKSTQHALPFSKLLRKETKFEWTDECEAVLKHLKETLSAPPVLSRPEQGEVLYLYLSVSSEKQQRVRSQSTSPTKHC